MRESLGEGVEKTELEEMVSMVKPQEIGEGQWSFLSTRRVAG